MQAASLRSTNRRRIADQEALADDKVCWSTGGCYRLGVSGAPRPRSDVQAYRAARLMRRLAIWAKRCSIICRLMSLGL